MSYRNASRNTHKEIFHHPVLQQARRNAGCSALKLRAIVLVQRLALIKCHVGFFRFVVLELADFSVPSGIWGFEVVGQILVLMSFLGSGIRQKMDAAHCRVVVASRFGIRGVRVQLLRRRQSFLLAICFYQVRFPLNRWLEVAS